VRQAGHNPEYVKASIESFQTFYNPRKKKLELMPNDESEVYEFMFRAEDLDGFTSVIEKTVTEINQAYMKWLESTDEFVDKEAVKEFAEISAQIAQLEIRAKELKERIGEQMVFGNKDSVGTDYGTFYFTTRKTYDYPKTLKVDYLDYGLTLEDTEAINACVKAVKTDYELSHEPVSVSRSVGFKPKRAK
jgi:hypothetical protein